MKYNSKEWNDNLNKMLVTLDKIKKLPVTDPGAYLHLGCGPRVFDGFINVDKYQKGEGILHEDMVNLPLPDNFAKAIYSSHALEHLNFRQAILALKKWNKLLQKGGTLYLAIPDLAETMSILLDNNVSWDRKWGWFVYILFGYQADPEFKGNDLNVPDDPGQHHRCGFTNESIQRFLVEAGFDIVEIYNYNGWETPSIWVEARKP